MDNIYEIIENLMNTQDASDSQLQLLLTSNASEEPLAAAADKVRRERYGTDVYIRGLIEFTNYCKNNCYYCGIRAGNNNLKRYRLSEEEILACCKEGYDLGFRTFVLQGGEDLTYSDDDICRMVEKMKHLYPDCAVTLSLGERSYDAYKRYYMSGADRYLLRHEAANDTLYGKLHPADMSLTNRKNCLYHLKEIGYQVGAGLMVGAPYQTIDNLIEDLRFLQDLSPDMIGIGPYMVHHDTPFKDMPNGSLSLTLKLLSIIRLMFPYVLLPATTALGTIHPKGREMGLKAGANVIMPNLSPSGVRELYSLYENKICTGEEAAECRRCLEVRVQNAGYHIVSDRGDVRR